MDIQLLEQLIAEIVADPEVRAQMLKPQKVDAQDISLDIYPIMEYAWGIKGIKSIKSKGKHRDSQTP